MTLWQRPPENGPRRRSAPIKTTLQWLGIGLMAAGAFGVHAAPTVDLTAYKGKVVYLDFWASWCHPCEQSFPYMEELKQRYRGDLVVVAVNVDHDRDRAEAFLERMHSDLPVIYDPKGAIATRYGVKDMPTSVLIGRDGQVRYVHKGFFPEQMPEYNTQLSELVHAH